VDCLEDRGMGMFKRMLSETSWEAEANTLGACGIAARGEERRRLRI